ncbi:hypothetical protein ElyMa_004580900 [Elysia marginata]|uniref:DUF6451 domain-containing protein n=1 Tax=Elysia marginata TaxID=1093978 RepID=A0AAV4HU00_9GAST|nr:hypothetical protein ElyMa_004580900 [Elysia marginata]
MLTVSLTLEEHQQRERSRRRRKWRQKACQDFIGLKKIWFSKLIKERTKIKIFNSNVKAVLFYRAETWRTYKITLQKLQSLSNRCMRLIIIIHWPEIISITDLWERTKQQPMEVEMREKVKLDWAHFKEAKAVHYKASLGVEPAGLQSQREAKNDVEERNRGRDDGGIEGDDTPGLKVNIKELDDVLLRDVGNRIKDSGKWPLLIDQSGQASTFLRYRDTNYINSIRPADMDNNNIRRSLLGAIRFGKPFVVDMMEVDMFDTCSDRFDEVQKDLMSSIVDKSILNAEKYLKLVKPEDGPEYDKTKFNDLRLGNFKFVLISKTPFPNPKLLEMFYVIQIIIPM